MEKEFWIYRITSPSGRKYVGQSTNINKRRDYYEQLKCKTQPMLYKSLLKYGFENHAFDIIHHAVGTKSEIDKWEQHYIAAEKSFSDFGGLNLTTGGTCCKFSEYTKGKMAQRSRENNPMYNPVHVRKMQERIRQVMKAKNDDLEYKAKVIERNYRAAETRRVRDNLKVSKLSIDGELIAVYSSLKEAAESVGSRGCKIGAVCSGARKTHMGFRWQYNKFH